jgi:hypothetical protein
MYMRILCFGSVERCPINIAYVHLGALLEQRFCDRQTNALRTSCNKRALAGKLKIE